MYYNILSSMSSGVITPSYTPRTTAFATATGIVDTTILNALNTFDLGLISNGLDTKMKALYPFVGGTATTHKYNFMDARDLDIAFRLQFNGGWTHSSTGILPNGTNGYANTFFNNNLINQNFGHISIYSKSDINSLSCDIGTDSNDGCTSIWTRNSNLTYSQVNNYLGNYLTISNTNSFGHYISNRIASNILNSWKNGNKQATSSILSRPAANLIYIGALNNGTAAEFFSSRQYAFSSIGDGLTDGEATIFYNLVQAMQTSLSRQV